MTPRGGKRAGAGRPKLDPGKRHVIVGVWLPGALLRMLDAVVPKGGRSAYIARAIQARLEREGKEK